MGEPHDVPNTRIRSVRRIEYSEAGMRRTEYPGRMDRGMLVWAGLSQAGYSGKNKGEAVEVANTPFLDART